MLVAQERGEVMRLVVAEKPSVAKAIAGALCDHPVFQSGFISVGSVGGEETLISWAAGHLVDLAEPAAYKPEWKKWNWDGLPLDPHGNWKWTVPSTAKKRYRELSQLLKKADTIVNACDPDREGEGIFTRIIRQAHQEKKTLLRLWANSIDTEGIRNAWKHLQPVSATRGLADASDARAKADWMTGMTASRAYSLLYNRKCAIGRVETPLLAMIVERDQQIAHHVPTPFYRVLLPIQGVTLTSEKIPTREQAEELAQSLPSQVTLSVEEKQVVKNPPLLHSLTSVQREANTRFALTAKETLSALQATYEKGLTTYPRTDSRYITSDDEATLTQLLEDPFLSTLQFTVHTPQDVKASRVVNNRKVEGHTALLPTAQLTPTAFKSLKESEQQVVGLLIQRMWQATSTPQLLSHTTICCTNNNMKFSATADRVVDPGWTRHTPSTQQDWTLPSTLTDGATLPLAGQPIVKESFTQPPKPYTEASLLADMEHAGRRVEDEALRKAIDDSSTHAGGIGTPATRASMIEKLLSHRYVIRSGGKITSTREGQQLISVLAPGLTSVEETARMEQGLTQITNNELRESVWLEQVSRQVATIPETARQHYQESFQKGNDMSDKESFGECPKCGSPVVKTGSIWQCSQTHNQKNADGSWTTTGCGWKLFGRIASHQLTDAQVRTLLSGETVEASDFVSKKSGKKFTARLTVDADKGVAFNFD